MFNIQIKFYSLDCVTNKINVRKNATEWFNEINILIEFVLSLNSFEKLEEKDWHTKLLPYCCEPTNIEYHNHMIEPRPKSNNDINFVVKKSNRKPVRQTVKLNFQLRKFSYEIFLIQFDIRDASKNILFLGPWFPGSGVLSYGLLATNKIA